MTCSTCDKPMFTTMHDRAFCWDCYIDFSEKQWKALKPPVPDVSSGDGIIRTNEQMEEWAKQSGCDYIEATDSELFIDIDTKEQLQTFWFNIDLAHKLFDIPGTKPGYWGLDRIKITDSKQGGDHKHIRIRLFRPLLLQDRILLQACLGSDLRREMISWERAQDGEKNVVIFFEKKETK